MGKKISHLKDDLLRYLAFVQDSLDEETAAKIGETVVHAMLDLIAKGISPIDGSRFPAYKWADLRNKLKKEKTAIAKQLKSNKQALFRFRRMNQRQMIVAQRNANRKDINVASAGYPFSVQHKYPDKRPRPVNLFLSGKFLAALQSRVKGTAGEFGLEIGFFDSAQALKELGHREGANGQALRPIIPINTEDFVQSIQQAIFDQIQAVLDKAAASGPSSS